MSSMALRSWPTRPTSLPAGPSGGGLTLARIDSQATSFATPLSITGSLLLLALRRSVALAAKKSKRGFAAEKPKKHTEVEVLEAQVEAEWSTVGW